MAEPTERMERLFFEVFEPLPRQGPGSRASAKRALDLCAGLPASPAVLDLGSGAGAQRHAGMGSARDVLAKIEASDLSLVDHFTLPYEDWWDDFYTPSSAASSSFVASTPLMPRRWLRSRRLPASPRCIDVTRTTTATSSLWYDEVDVLGLPGGRQ